MHFQPMIQFSSQVWECMVAPRRMVHLLMHAPSSTTTSGPMVTLGPMRQFFPILAEESTSTLPTTPVQMQSVSIVYVLCTPMHSSKHGRSCPLSLLTVQRWGSSYNSCWSYPNGKNHNLSYITMNIMHPFHHSYHTELSLASDTVKGGCYLLCSWSSPDLICSIYRI